MNLKPYIAMDIETTGLDTDIVQAIEVAMIFDNGLHTVKELVTDRFYIDHGTFVGEPFALSMHPHIFRAIANSRAGKETDVPVLSKEQALHRISTHLAEWWEKCTEKPTLAGKNLAIFDIPVLTNNGLLTKEYYKHRVLDTGPLYLPDFGYVPNQDEINTKIGRKSVSHKALDDCYDVVYAIRAKFGENCE